MLFKERFLKCGCKGSDYFLICKYFAIFFCYFFIKFSFSGGKNGVIPIFIYAHARLCADFLRGGVRGGAIGAGRIAARLGPDWGRVLFITAAELRRGWGEIGVRFDKIAVRSEWD